MSNQPTQPRRDRKLASPPSSLRLSIARSFVTANTQQTEKAAHHEHFRFPASSDASQTSDVGHVVSHCSSPHAQIIPNFVTPITQQVVKSPSDLVYFPSNTVIDIHKHLPPVVESIRAGWQQTCQGSAVVSALLAAVAAQLLQYFRDDNTYNRRQSSTRERTAILALCYATLFLNVGATISAFVIIDKMGALASNAAVRNNRPPITFYDGSEVKLLEQFGAGSTWKYIMAEWLITFYAGVLCLVAQLLMFVWLQEALAIGISMSILIALAIIPPMISLVFGSRSRQ